MLAAGGEPGQGSGVSRAPQLSPGPRWRRVFPGEERQLAVLRRWLASLLPEGPARDDVATVANELASNAVKHTASGRGGTFAVEIAAHESVVRVAVADLGAPTSPRVIDDLAAENGRGLLLASGLSVRTGMHGGPTGRLVWADIRWDGMAPAAPETRDPHESTQPGRHAQSPAPLASGIA